MKAAVVAVVLTLALGGVAYFSLRDDPGCQPNGFSMQGTVLPGGPQTDDAALAAFLDKGAGGTPAEGYDVSDFETATKEGGRTTFASEDGVSVSAVQMFNGPTHGWFVSDVTRTC